MKYEPTVAIIGYGYVGSAVASVFSKKEVFVVDPKYSRNRIRDIPLNSTKVVFVCVDTPDKENFKTLDTVLQDLNNTLKKGTVVCCKSTATPCFYKKAKKIYKNIKIVFSPEFLSHHSNIVDFKNQCFLIIGGEMSAAKKVANILIPRLKNVSKANFTDIETAALIKYIENCYLAFKITFFNEMYRIHSKLNIPSTFNHVIDLLTLDKRIGKSHTQVPGRDGKRGWGGHCLPKDNNEFFRLTNSHLIKFLIELNKIHRNK